MTGRLTLRLGRRPLLVTAALFLMGALGLLTVAPSLAVLVAAAAPFGLGEGAMIPTLHDITVGAASPTTRGSLMAVSVASARLGQTIGPLGATVALGRNQSRLPDGRDSGRGGPLAARLPGGPARRWEPTTDRSTEGAARTGVRHVQRSLRKRPGQGIPTPPTTGPAPA
ncbi:MAG: MFS transporter [Acidimicrobiia bacterium]